MDLQSYDDALDACAEVQLDMLPGDAIRHQNDQIVDLLEALENLLWHAEKLEEFQESERGKGLSADQLYEAGEMHAYMVNAKDLIARAKGEA